MTFETGRTHFFSDFFVFVAVVVIRELSNRERTKLRRQRRYNIVRTLSGKVTTALSQRKGNKGILGTVLLGSPFTDRKVPDVQKTMIREFNLHVYGKRQIQVENFAKQKMIR